MGQGMVGLLPRWPRRTDPPGGSRQSRLPPRHCRDCHRLRAIVERGSPRAEGGRASSTFRAVPHALAPGRGVGCAAGATKVSSASWETRRPDVRDGLWSHRDAGTGAMSSPEHRPGDASMAIFARGWLRGLARSSSPVSLSRPKPSPKGGELGGAHSGTRLGSPPPGCSGGRRRPPESVPLARAATAALSSSRSSRGSRKRAEPFSRTGTRTDIRAGLVSRDSACHQLPPVLRKPPGTMLVLAGVAPTWAGTTVVVGCLRPLRAARLVPGGGRASSASGQCRAHWCRVAGSVAPQARLGSLRHSGRPGIPMCAMVFGRGGTSGLGAMSSPGNRSGRHQP